LGDELGLGLRVVHQDQIGIAMVNSGRMCARRPEFSTDVVDASTIASSARLRPPANITGPIRIAASFRFTTTVLFWHRRQRSWR
jgi:hypothetical protein